MPNPPIAHSSLWPGQKIGKKTLGVKVKSLQRAREGIKRRAEKKRISNLHRAMAMAMLQQQQDCMGQQDSSSSSPSLGLTLVKSPFSHTQYPYVTGSSVLGIKYKDGVLIAADCGGSYGSTLRYKSVERLKTVGKSSVIGGSGEISDFQQIMRYLDELTLNDSMWDDGNTLGPKEVHNYLSRVMYNRRNKFDPLWNTLVLGGVKRGVKYLGMVSMIGVHFQEDHVASGFGNHLARPIFRDEWKEDLTLEEGILLLEKCFRVLLYRDRSAVNKIQIANVTDEGTTISKPYALQTQWDYKAFHNPTQGVEGSW